MSLNFQKAKKMKLSDYEILQTVGTGSFGRVRLAKNKTTNKYFAIKILKKHEIIKLKQVDHIINETTILSNLNHPFIVNMDGYCQDQRYLYLILEYIPGGELFTYLRGIGRLNTQHAAQYAGQITLIFEYLHSKGIVYRDLKPENLLIAEDGFLKLTDFGFAKVVEGRTYTLCGTPEYLAPEILLNKGKYFILLILLLGHGKPVDWWTLGIIVYEMNVGIDPFSAEDPMEIYQKILKGKIKFPRNVDKNAKSLIKHLLVSDLSKRYGNLKNGVNDIKKHRWFNEIDWNQLVQKQVKPFYRPAVKSAHDTTNYSSYPDSGTPAPAIKENDDPFAQW